MTPKKLLLPVLAILILAQFQVFQTSAATSKDEAASALVNAEKDTASAYGAVINAEDAGVNISRLLAELNEAGVELSTAENAFREGDFNLAIDSANACSLSAYGVKAEADRLQVAALGSRYMDVWFRVAVSVLSVIAIGFGSFWTWRLFKKRYYEKVSEMKLEVASDES